MDRTCQQQGSFKKNRNKSDTFNYNQKRTVKMSWTHNKERELKKFEIHTTYDMLMARWETASNLPSELVQMDGRIRTGKFSKVTNIA